MMQISDFLKNDKWLVIASVVIVGHFCWVMAYFEPAISSPDANGYFAQAKLIATKGQTWFSAESLLQYTGAHWIDTGDGRFFSRYPPGLPMIAAAFFVVDGYEAALLVNPLMTSFTLLGLFLLCRLWVGEKWALLAVIVMAFNPVVNGRALIHDAHVGVAFFLVWGLYLLARWSVSRSAGLAFFAGLCFGVIPTIRYPEALFGFAIGLFFLYRAYEDRRARKSVVYALLGALIPIGALMVRNHLAFGAFWKTGYSLTSEQTAFAWSYFVQYGPQYLQNILGSGMGLFAALAVLGICMLCTQAETRRYGLLLAGLILPTTLLYMAYYFMVGSGAGSLRFLHPTFYIYAVAGVWMLKMIQDAMGRRAYVAVVGLVGITVLWGYPQTMQSFARMRSTNSALATITDTIKNEVAPGEIVVAPGSIQQHLDFAGNWRLIDSSLFAEPRDMRRMFTGVIDKAMPNPIAHTVGRREAQAQYWDNDAYGLAPVLFEDLNAWSGDTVYWVGTYEELMGSIPTSDSLEIVAEIDLSQVANMARGPEGMHGGMPGGFRGGAPSRRGGRPGGGLMASFTGEEKLLLAKWMPSFKRS